MAGARDALILSQYQQATKRTTAQVTAYAERIWLDLGSWRDPDIDRFIGRLAPVVAAAQRQAATMTAAYLSALTKSTTGDTYRTALPDLTDLRGVPATELYRRPALTLWHLLAEGEDLDVGVKAGAERLDSIVATDVQLARTHTSRAFMLTAGASGFRRVTNGDCCELCDEATSETYSTDALLPIHNHCDCGVEPVFGKQEPKLPQGDPVNEDRGRPTVVEHGEIGPTLVVEGHAFRGPDDL